MRFFLVAAGLLCGLTLRAQINVSGDVYGIWGDTTEDYRVVGDITVPAGQSLTITAGVSVRFMDDYNFTIYGDLVVNGALEDSVIFTYYYGSIPGSWGMIEFDGVLPGVTTLNYCRIEAGDRAIYVNDCSITLNHSLLRETALSPVKAENGQITMSHCVITEGGGSGLSLQNSSVNLIECEITYNGGLNGRGINASGGGTITVTGGYIGMNAGSGIYGMQLTGVSLSGVEIADNDGYGITLTNGGELQAYRLLIHHNESHGIFLSSNSMDGSNLTISGNGGKGISSTNALLELSSSIVDRNENGGIYCQSSQAFLTYNCAFNSVDNYVGCTPGVGSIEEDPLYISVSNRNYYLQAGSPCIDAGSPYDPQDPDSTITDMGAFFFDQTAVLPGGPAAEITVFRIVNAYPNPFNPVLTLIVSAPAPAPGRLEAYTSDGKKAAVIWKGILSPGLNTIRWDASGMNSGPYFVRFEAGGTTQYRRCVLLK